MSSRWAINYKDLSFPPSLPQEANQKKERATTSDEQRERTLIAEQIARANAEAEADNNPISATQMGLQREGAAPLKLTFAPKKTNPSPSEAALVTDPSWNDSSPSAGSSSSPDTAPLASPNHETTATSTLSSSAKPTVQTPLKMNTMPKPMAPLKMNVFKAAAKQQSSSGSNGAKRGMDDLSMSNTQRLIKEDQERKRRRMNAGIA